MGLDDLATGRGELGLVLGEAGAHLGRVTDELCAEALGVGPAGHLLLQ